MNVIINNCTSFSFRKWGNYTIEDFLNAVEANGCTSARVFCIDLSDEEIEIPWGPFFDRFPTLESVAIHGSAKVKLNCCNFANSNVKAVSISGHEIWFNDGVFMDAPMLRNVSIYGRIIDGTHGGFSELTFKNCEKLECVEGSYHGLRIMPCVFENCRALVRPMDFYVDALGFRCFASCSSLKQIHLHNGLIDMGAYSFEKCSSLEDIYIPDTVRDMGINTFMGCGSLKKIHIPNNISEIRESVFEDCKSLGKVFLPDSLCKIGRCAFKNCSSLLKPWLPNGLLSIGEQAFAGCSTIKEIWIPESVTSIGKDAFAECPGLTIRGKAGSTAELYAKENGIVFLPD